MKLTTASWPTVSVSPLRTAVRKPSSVGPDFVAAHGQRGKPVGRRRHPKHRPRQAGLGVRGRQRRAGNEPAAGIPDRAENRAVGSCANAEEAIATITNIKAMDFIVLRIYSSLATQRRVGQKSRVKDHIDPRETVQHSTCAASLMTRGARTSRT